MDCKLRKVLHYDTNVVFRNKPNHCMNRSCHPCTRTPDNFITMQMLDTGKPSFTPSKGKTNIVMFVGLQGSGKTTSCTKYANYYQKKGWKPALVCADTFRAGAFDQLKQNAVKTKIPFYGSYTDSDPVTVAVQGKDRFMKENCDLIIIDTSGRHQQEASLFEEMRQLAEATKPDLVVFVMDSSIGQAAFSQAQAFKQNVPVGAIIVTKTEGNAKGGGVLSAVAATKSPVIFLGTGEHLHEFDVFDVEPFVRHLLGMKDWSGLMRKIHEVMPTLSEGHLTLRMMYEQYCQNLLNMSPSQDLVDRAEIKHYMTIIDSMTNKGSQTDPKIMNESRIQRIARGSGRPVKDVKDMLDKYKQLAKCMGSLMKKLKISKNGEVSQSINARQLSRALPPQMLRER
ncbi:hypothetical protein MKW92_016530, partial [Papaver armeniacum]